MKNKKYLLLLLIIPIIIVVGRSFALPFNGEIKSLEIKSDNYDSSGSYKLEKKVDWVENGKAEITYTLETKEKNEGIRYKDIVIVLDKSNSMNEGKFEKAKNNSIELINSLLGILNNRVALITFDSTATIKSDFTNNKEALMDYLGNINIGGKANFNNALLKVDELLNNYDKLEDHDLVVLFLTNGNPNEGIPNDQASYGMLKDKYPYININGVQYEEDINVVDGIKNISDNQFIARDTNILNEAILTSLSYEKLIISDILNNVNFNISSVNDIKTNNGTVELTTDSNNQKIVWNLNNTKTGVTSTMVATINLRNELKNQDGLYSTNKSTTIVSKLGGENKTTTSEDTLKIKNKYTITYNLNKPGNCDITSIPSESHFVGDSVTKKTQSLTCDGYYVQTWVFNDNSNVNFINGSTFIMPSHDITLHAVWVKSAIEKSMDGVVLEKANTLYRVLQDAAIEGTYAREYTGPHMDSNTQPATKNIYHWYADRYDNDKGAEITNKYYVKFGDYCWNMIRTTDTGGVRLLYRGRYSDETKCQRINPGFAYSYYSDYMYLYPEYSSYNYYYATDYIYNEDTHVFTLSGDIVQKSIGDEDIDNFIGMYTCKSTSSQECTTIYKVFSRKEKGVVNLIPMRYYDYVYESLGMGPYNTEYVSSSLSGIGYMYGDYAYKESSKYLSNYISYATDTLLIGRRDFSTSYYVSDELVYAYTSYGNDYYRLKNPVRISTITDRDELKGKYWATSSSSAFYDIYNHIIGEVDNRGNMYYLRYYYYEGNEDGTTSYTYYYYYSIKVGDSITKNDDGTYTLNNVTDVGFYQFLKNYTTFVGKYICEDGTTTCKSPWYINNLDCYECNTSTGYAALYVNHEDANRDLLIAKNREGNQLLDTLIVDKYEFLDNFSDYSEYKYTCGDTSSVCDDRHLYIMMSGSYRTSTYNSLTGDEYIDYASLGVLRNTYYYGSDVTWDGTKYTLVDPVEFEVYKDDDLFSHHHFTCLTPKTTSCETVNYIYYASGSDIYYITLSNGEKDIETIVDSMLSENKYDSYIKAVIDDWYSRKMTKYNDYLEDSVYCNNRKMDEKNGWNPNGGNIRKFSSINNEYPYNDGHYYTGNSLYCEQETDRFSMDNPKAQLKYPVGLLSYSEMYLLGNDKARENYVSWMTMTGYAYSTGTGFISNRYYGSLYTSSGTSFYIVPSITLKYGTEYIAGDGTINNPYIVDTSEVDN